MAGSLFGYLIASPALAFAIDQIAEQSSLGEPLRIVFPITKEPGEVISGECIRVVPAQVGTPDGVPEVRSSRISLEQKSSSSRVIVSSSLPMNDPAARITLEVGCETRLRREYVMLFDLPVITAGTLSASAGDTNSYADIKVATEHSQAVQATKHPTVPIDSQARTARARTATGTGRDRQVVRQRPPVKPHEEARLAVSRTAFGIDAENHFATSSDDAKLASVREQEIVLRNRVAELSVTVVRMQQEQIEGLTAEVERLKAEVRAAKIAQHQPQEIARTTPWSTLALWIGAVWPIVIAGLATIALGIGIVVWRKLSPSRLPVQVEPSIIGSSLSQDESELGVWHGHGSNLTEMPSFSIHDLPRVQAMPLSNEKVEHTEQERDFERDVADYVAESRRVVPTT